MTSKIGGMQMKEELAIEECRWLMEAARVVSPRKEVIYSLKREVSKLRLVLCDYMRAGEIDKALAHAGFDMELEARLLGMPLERTERPQTDTLAAGR